MDTVIIETLEELAALPVGSGIHDASEQSFVIGAGIKGIIGPIRLSGNNAGWVGSYAIVNLPANVVYYHDPVASASTAAVQRIEATLSRLTGAGWDDTYSTGRKSGLREAIEILSGK